MKGVKPTGIFDFLRKRREAKENMRYASMLNGSTPIFSQFGTSIYASDVVQQAIYTIVTEMRKLNPRHVRRDGSDMTPIYNDVQRVLEDPNPLMTKSDFIEKITWQLMLNYNAFIYMQRSEKGILTGLFPLNPVEVTFLEKAGRLFLQLQFLNGDSHILPYESFIHLKTHYSVNEYMGGNENGQPDFSGLLTTLDLNHALLDGVKKALRSSFAINGIIKYKTMLDDGKMEAHIREFEEKLQKSASGILGIDLSNEVIQFKRDLKIVDDKTLKFIDDKILRFFGVPIEIVRGDYTAEQYQAFYQKTIEPLVIMYSQAFTKGIFSAREQHGFRNEIIFSPKELVFMNAQQTLEMVNLLGQTGTLYENEKRIAFGYEPLEELKGVRLMSLNYVDVKLAAQYQVGQDKKEDEDNG